MTEKKNPKTNTKIKATTGAWWKSTVVDEENDQKQQQKGPAGKNTSTRTSRSPRKNKPTVSPKASETQSDSLAAESGNENTPAAEVKTPARKSRSTGRSRKKTDENQVKDAAEGNTKETEISSDGDVSESAARSAEVSTEEKKIPAKRGRSTRGRKKSPAKGVKEEGDIASAESVVESAQSEQVDNTAESVSVEDHSEGERKETRPKKKSSGRKPRGRRKKETEVEEKAGKAQLTEEQEPRHREDAVEIPAGTEEDLDESTDDELEEDAIKEKVVLKLLINAEEPEECRLALLENGRLESIHVSTINRTQTKNNIYKGRIVAIEPNLQAAFVDYGTEKNGFLPFSEIHPEYYKQELSEDIQKLVDAHHWKRLSITDVVEKGQDVLVQVVKEEVGKKGANMTTYLSLPGRSVVLMPGSDSSGISRKISGEERRSQLRTAMNAQKIPEGIGWIVRTASADITKTALARDVGYLLGLWEEIKKKAQDLEGIGQVYEDHQSVLRFLREHFDPEIEEIQVDDKEAMDQVKKFISLLPSKHRDVKVRLHKGARPIFNQYSIEDQIESIYQPRVNLPSGGSIVIDPTEALVAIDVNSGSTSKGKNFDQSIYQANMEAAKELARQLRLRDLGGLIVVDFIDMRNKKHIRDVEKEVRLAMKRDKAKVDFSRISKFGLMQISRQKLGAPIEAGNYRVCKHCKGRGTVRSVETLALFYLRRIQTGASRKHVQRVECRFPMDVAQYLLNQKRHEIQDHESRYNTEIVIIPDISMSPVDNEILLLKKEKEQEGKKQA